jgi:hypothetical protein
MTQTYSVGARSRLVTVVAWMFILLGTLATAWAALQQASALSSAPSLAMAGAPWLAGDARAAYLPWVATAALALAVATLTSAVGLLLRLDWARRAFIGVLALAIAANLLGLWIQHEIVQSVVVGTLGAADLPPQAVGVFGGFVTAARVLGGFVTLAACALLASLIGHLMSARVRQEFA